MNECGRMLRLSSLVPLWTNFYLPADLIQSVVVEIWNDIAFIGNVVGVSEGGVEQRIAGVLLPRGTADVTRLSLGAARAPRPD